MPFTNGNRQSYDYPEDREVWERALIVLPEICNFLEFNILYNRPGPELEQIMEQYNGVLHRPLSYRLYAYGRKGRLRLPVNPQTVVFLRNKDFMDWNNGLLEDPSLLVGEDEILGSITHEGMFELKRGWV
ncbi:MAG: hypothetical protein AAF433_08925 [Bacteroidota bacterium]